MPGAFDFGAFDLGAFDLGPVVFADFDFAAFDFAAFAFGDLPFDAPFDAPFDLVAVFFTGFFAFFFLLAMGVGCFPGSACAACAAWDGGVYKSRAALLSSRFPSVFAARIPTIGAVPHAAPDASDADAAAETRTAPRRAAALLARWPRETPVAALLSGGAGAQSGWTILARPTETVAIPASAMPDEVVGALSGALARTPRDSSDAPRADDGDACTPRRPPFTGGWIVALGYGLGQAFEPSVRSRHAHEAPFAVLHWCEDAWCLDHATGALHAIGAPPALADAHDADGAPSATTPRAWRLTTPLPDESDHAYAAAVARAVEAIHAGDAFQTNIARRFTARLEGDLRAFAADAVGRNASWFGALVGLPDGGAVVSLSPELFLRVSPDGTVRTRPIKGTRPASAPLAELDESEKDAAELAMIVDLMRNDLGRVAETGSVKVDAARLFETHTTVHHGVAEVSARIADGVSWLDLLRATFPPGSVTGAPKIRAMQLIDELEPAARGFYCGAVGFVSRSGHAALNVAIRTAQIGPPDADGGRTVAYHAGCGIVADSDPVAETEETIAKAAALARLAGPGVAVGGVTEVGGAPGVGAGAGVGEIGARGGARDATDAAATGTCAAAATAPVG